MDKTQCVHVFEITRSRCLSCGGRNRVCGEYEERRSYHENKDEPFGGDGPDPGQRGAAELLGSQSLAVVMQPDKNGKPQTEKARRLRAEAIPKGVPTEFRVPALRTPRTRREQQLKMVGDRAATMAWQLMALACVQELGFGADRLNRLYAEMRHNYEQLNEWGKTDGLDVAMEKLRRCACDALQTEDIVVENVDDEKTVQTLSRSYKEQEAEFLKRAVMMAAGRKACRQSLNVLNEESVRQKCADAMAAATGSNLSPLRSGYASALQSSPDMGAKDQGGR